MDDDWKRRRLERVREELVRGGDPVAWVREADGVEASLRFPHLALRGPLFGVAVEREHGWEVVREVGAGMPQEARDSLNSLLWFRAKDDTDDRDVRRDLLAAVAILEQEPVDEIVVLGERYRIVRADEFARSGETGLEPPRATDPDATEPVWDHRSAPPSPDLGFLLAPERADGLTQEALKLGLRDFSYAGKRFPDDVRDESLRAVDTHPDIVLLPVGFGVAERRGAGWRPVGVLQATPHEARRTLYSGLTELWAMIYEFGERKAERYRLAGEEFRAAGRANEARIDDRLFRICRIERLVRCGEDGPEPPRPSDIDQYGPMKMHPTMDLDGVLHPER
ncbi:DUF5954 family protein [Streptomyces sp. NPDC026092]|uniref:DUF5954 family protein n=1 Tax=Streptomyces sp. NPDC026092 TaxID=3154797 RepID=UPI00340E4ADD